MEMQQEEGSNDSSDEDSELKPQALAQTGDGGDDAAENWAAGRMCAGSEGEADFFGLYFQLGVGCIWLRLHPHSQSAWILDLGRRTSCNHATGMNVLCCFANGVKTPPRPSVHALTG